MDVHIMGIIEAVEFIPIRLTYALRIANSINDFTGRFPLHESPFYAAIRTYVFDDVEQLFDRGRLMTGEIAHVMLDDFVSERDGCGTLLVHCTRGRNRSPAVALAFNEIFSLGHDPKYLQGDRHDMEINWYVYRTLMAEAKKMNL
ncbi:MAG: hypothetical protein ABIJ21_06895 [Nanoarchaeota archaeon]